MVLCNCIVLICRSSSCCGRSTQERALLDEGLRLAHVGSVLTLTAAIAGVSVSSAFPALPWTKLIDDVPWIPLLYIQAACPPPLWWMGVLRGPHEHLHPWQKRQRVCRERSPTVRPHMMLLRPAQSWMKMRYLCFSITSLRCGGHLF